MKESMKKVGRWEVISSFSCALGWVELRSIAIDLVVCVVCVCVACGERYVLRVS